MSEPSDNPGHQRAPDILLRAAHVHRQFGGVVALDDVTLEIRAGEHVGLVGDNGAGKSTLVKIVTGADSPDEGEIEFGGETVYFASPLDARRAGIETVYQTLALADELDVVGNLFLGREKLLLRLGPMSVLDRRGMRKEAAAMLAKTGVVLPDMRAALRKLSGGQRQGIAIARAVGWGSRLIVMDEPTAALGVRETAKVEEMIRNLKAAHVAVLLVSHNLRQVFELTDRICVLRHGRLVGNDVTKRVSPEDVVRMITGVDDILADGFA